MNAPKLNSPARALLACATALAVGAVAAGQLSAGLTVKVKLVRSSGACGAAGGPAVHVRCGRPPAAQPGRPGSPPVVPGGPLLPDAGQVPYQRVGTIDAGGVATQPLPLYSDGTKITSWRVVTLDNARYVELTIAW